MIELKGFSGDVPLSLDSDELRFKVLSDVLIEYLEPLEGLLDSEDLSSLKQARSSVRKDYGLFEDKRKSLKRSSMDMYNSFESMYKKYISSVYESYDNRLKAVIDGIESSKLKEKEMELRVYLDSLLVSTGIDYIGYDHIGLNLIQSKSINDYKREIKDFVDGIKVNEDTLKGLPNIGVSLPYYRRTLDFREALLIANGNASSESIIEDINAEDVIVLSSPVVVEEEKEFTMTFTVKASKEKLSKLKSYIKEIGINILN